MNSFLGETDCLERFKTNVLLILNLYIAFHLKHKECCFVYSGNQGNIIIMFHKRHLLLESCIYTQLFLFRADVVT